MPDTSTAAPQLFGTVGCDTAHNTITLNVGVQFSGPASGNTAWETNLLENGSAHLSGTYTAPNSPPITVQASLHAGTDLQIVLQPAVTGNERSYMDDLEATTGTWYTNATGYTAAHETMHSFGLDDTYREGPWPSSTPGLMGTYGDKMVYGEAASLYQTYCGAPNPDVSTSLIGVNYYDLLFPHLF